MFSLSQKHSHLTWMKNSIGIDYFSCDGNGNNDFPSICATFWKTTMSFWNVFNAWISSHYSTPLNWTIFVSCKWYWYTDSRVDSTNMILSLITKDTENLNQTYPSVPKISKLIGPVILYKNNNLQTRYIFLHNYLSHKHLPSTHTHLIHKLETYSHTHIYLSLRLYQAYHLYAYHKHTTTYILTKHTL